jgi:PAS domain S-box-containing protein
MSFAITPRVLGIRIGELARPVRKFQQQLALAVGKSGMLWASVAIVVGLLTCITTLVTLLLSVNASEVDLAKTKEAQVLAFNKANHQLDRTIYRMTSGAFVPAAGEHPAWDAWQAFQGALKEMCAVLDPAVPKIDHLRQTCDPKNPINEKFGAEIAAFDPPHRTLSPTTMHELQMLRDDVVALTELTAERTDELEYALAHNYKQALIALALGSVGFAGSGMVLLMLVGRASVRHHARWEEATQERVRLHSIIESSGAVILLTDRDLNIVTANRGFWKALGVDPAGATGRKVSDLMEIRIDSKVLARWRGGPLSAKDRKPVQYIRSSIHPDGRSRVMSITATPVVDDDHIMRQIVFLGVDDTERSETEQALSAADRMSTLGEMAATMVHELRQPLQIINLVCESTLEELTEATPSAPLDIPQVCRKLERISTQIKRADGIIEDLRIYARGSAGDVAKPFDAAIAIAGAVDMTSGGARMVEVKVTQSLQERLPSLVGHPNKLQQVLINLINNARDAGSHAVDVSAALQVTDQRWAVRIAVEDDGPGIPDEMLPRLFHSFVTTKTAGKGTGLGLRMCRRIVEEMGGSITAGNRPQGGARFEMLFPVGPVAPG